MPYSFMRLALFCVALFCSGLACQGGMTSYTDRGTTDFDTVLPLLNPYGTWSKIDGLWAYTPLDHQAPYTNGRWLYTEYGWYWKGSRPHSWATEHYGYWKRGADKVWSWYPGPYWLPVTVEIRTTTTHIGWRSAAVDEKGSFVEKPDDRYAKTDEWTFVALPQFADPITPGIIAKPEVAKQLLEDSTECRHSYFTYREIDRLGPHPADFLKFGDGGMYPPFSREELAAHPPPAPTPSTNAPGGAASQTNGPGMIVAVNDPDNDKRQVIYWLSMSLPTYWTKPPDDAKPRELYLYRPDFYQDDDGIARRITLWFNPAARTTLKEALAGSPLGTKSAPGSTNGTPGSATGEESSQARDPFHIPLEDGAQTSAPHTPSASSKNPNPPSGTNTMKTPIPLPYATNSAPVNPPH